MRRNETPKPIWIKFCMMVDIADVVTYTNFGDHRLRVFWVAGGQIPPSPIDFHSRPYNTLALPCERVIEPNFFLVKDIHDVIKHAKFGDDRLRGSGVVAGQISAFPIDFAGRP